jgi:hypothetical protein
MDPTEADGFPPWYDEKTDYTQPRFKEALAFGRAAANSAHKAQWEWPLAEPSLMEVWSMSPRQGKWMDVRGAVFYAWHEARLTLPSRQAWSGERY